ncbi:MAG: metal-dependent hydrolase [Pseudohongiellaceae bacterium]
MDPISQGAIGALAAQTSVRHKNLAKVTLVGCLAGLAPDLDVLIQSREDPILFLEYHRQFTHSLLFIPFGSFLVAITLLGFLKDSLNFKTIYLASFLGFATHGLLDACTSYGTQLFWPFSNTRVSWNNISIVDPLFTLPIIFLIITGLKTKRRLISFTAAGWAVIYLSLGFYQYERAFSAAMQVANARGHRAERLTLKPSFGNIILWKAIYQHDEYYFHRCNSNCLHSTVVLW